MSPYGPYEVVERLGDRARNLYQVRDSRDGRSGLLLLAPEWTTRLPFFLAAFRTQKELAEAGAARWAHVYEFNCNDFEPYAIVEFLPWSLRGLLTAGKRPTAAQLANLAQGVLLALMDLQGHAQREHGQLDLDTVRFRQDPTVNEADFAGVCLTGLLPLEEGAASPAPADLRALGRLLHQFAAGVETSDPSMAALPDDRPIFAVAEPEEVETAWRGLLNNLLQGAFDGQPAELVLFELQQISAQIEASRASAGVSESGSEPATEAQPTAAPVESVEEVATGAAAAAVDISGDRSEEPDRTPDEARSGEVEPVPQTEEPAVEAVAPVAAAPVEEDAEPALAARVVEPTPQTPEPVPAAPPQAAPPQAAPPPAAPPPAAPPPAAPPPAAPPRAVPEVLPPSPRPAPVPVVVPMPAPLAAPAPVPVRGPVPIATGPKRRRSPVLWAAAAAVVVIVGLVALQFGRRAPLTPAGVSPAPAVAPPGGATAPAVVTVPSPAAPVVVAEPPTKGTGGSSPAAVEPPAVAPARSPVVLAGLIPGWPPDLNAVARGLADLETRARGGGENRPRVPVQTLRLALDAIRGRVGDIERDAASGSDSAALRERGLAVVSDLKALDEERRSMLASLTRADEADALRRAQQQDEDRAFAEARAAFERGEYDRAAGAVQSRAGVARFRELGRQIETEAALLREVTALLTRREYAVVLERVGKIPEPTRSRGPFQQVRVGAEAGLREVQLAAKAPATATPSPPAAAAAPVAAAEFRPNPNVKLRGELDKSLDVMEVWFGVKSSSSSIVYNGAVVQPLAGDIRNGPAFVARVDSFYNMYRTNGWLDAERSARLETLRGAIRSRAK